MHRKQELNNCKCDDKKEVNCKESEDIDPENNIVMVDKVNSDIESSGDTNI